jgi:serine/threonine protein kinase
MGEIVLAEQTGLSGFCKRVVVKRIRPELARDPDYVRLFLNEARTGSFINHPNIVHVFDVGHEDGQLYLVMEYVDGLDLKRLRRRAALAQRALVPTALASIAVEVLCALAWAHRGGPVAGTPIIHRDISPENIVITREGYVKVLDFGLAKWWPRRSRVSSLEGRMIFGKVRYMPPEQLRGLEIDARADLFSLGVVLYETLRGELPFGRGAANEVLAEIRRGPPPPPTEGAGAPDPAMDALVQRALAPDPDDRWPSAEAMRRDFVAYLRAKGAVLPREDLRALLTGTTPRVEDRPHLPSGMDPGPAEELSLPVADRCGKCGGSLHAFVVDDLILDQCDSCFGIWVDRGEIDRILGSGLDTASHVGAETPVHPPSLDGVLGSCPIDRVGLTAIDVPRRNFSLEVCPLCRGMWFDRDELAALSEGDVAEWLRGALSRVTSSDDLRTPD